MNNLIQNFTTNFKRERFLFIYAMVTLVITFLIFGFFVGLVVLTQTGIRTLEEQAQLTLFFKDDFPESNILELQSNLENDSRVLQTTYISKQKAFEIFTEVNKDSPLLLEAISESILPASLEVKSVKISDLSVLRDELSSIDGVEEIKFFEDVVERFSSISNVIYIIGVITVLLFMFISVAIVITVFRIIIDSKGKEYEILKLVGASDDYVKKPIIFQGIALGFISASIAAVLLIPNYGFIVSNVFQFENLVVFGFLIDILGKINTWLFSGILGLLMILAGILLGYFGSLLAIKRYLKF